MATGNWTDKHPSRRKTEHRAPVALMLQGGGALGAYQVGAFEAMAEAGIQPDWVSGISIGGINATIIAGNPPEKRAEKLKAFWDEIATGSFGPDAVVREGVPGFFVPAENAASNVFLDLSGLRPLLGRHVKEHASMYDPSPLVKTLQRFVDFDYLNDARNPTRLSLGAANVETRELVYFDNKVNLPTEKAKQAKNYGIMRNEQSILRQHITPKHVLASGALIPNFPPVEIEGVHYCDGGLVSNTPVRFAHETGQLRKDMLVIRPDLWNPHGNVPHTHDKALERQLEIQFASPKIELDGIVRGHIHTTCARRTDQHHNKFYDFSKNAVQKNRQAGYDDMSRAIEEYRRQEAGRKQGTITVGNGGDALFHHHAHGQHSR